MVICNWLRRGLEVEGDGTATVAVGGAFACGSEGREWAVTAETEVGS